MHPEFVPSQSELARYGSHVSAATPTDDEARIRTRDPARERILVVTGANGQLGRALLAELARAATSPVVVRALVRSARAADSIRALALSPAPEIRIVDYGDPAAMTRALEGATGVVHLVGIIKETRDTRYADAHESTCAALAAAATRTGVERIVYLSILGSEPASTNPCLASKGRAEAILLAGSVDATILRVPMVIGGDDAASASLRRQAQAKKLRLVAGGQTLQQPIDARDVVAAIRAALSRDGAGDLVLDAGGPECLSHRELVLRTARLWQNAPQIRSLPYGLARAAVSLLERLRANPPISRAMFDILQHDDEVDVEPFCRALGVALRPLDQTLADFVGPTSIAAASERT